MFSLKKVFEFYINSNIHVAIAASCLLGVVSFYLDLFVPYETIFLFFATFLSYNYIRYRKWRNKELKKETDLWFEKNKTLLFVLNIVTLIGVVFCLFQFKRMSLLLIIPFGVITLLYMIPVFKLKGVRITLRTLPSLKIFSIAISWAGLVVLFPAMENNLLFDVRVFYLFVMMLFFVIALTLPFDIRDMKFDSNLLNTLPQLMGLKKVKIFGICCVVFVFILDFFIFHFNESTLIIAVLLCIMLLISSKNQSKFFASFWVEGIPIVWYCLFKFF
jgi:hypothetical protein